MNMFFNIKTDACDLDLLEAIQDGLPLCPRPFAKIGEQLSLTEEEVIERFERLQKNGIIKRFGLVLQHRSLGYRANAMVVWDVPDMAIDEVAQNIIAHDFVTLCYCRSRQKPDWPYNLYCMIHGQQRPVVETQIEQLKTQAKLSTFPSQTLFSSRRFKQTGARFTSAHQTKRRVI